MRPARARAPDDRDVPVPAQRADVDVRVATRRITNLVNSREIWIVFNLNPDGSEYDIATGSYRSWRKNRQPNSGSSAVGTDLNRNWSFQWGCCGGSSGTFSSETYRGPSRVLGARDPARARLRQQPRRRRRAADQGRHRLPHLLGARAVAVRLHDREHDARRSPPTTRRRSRTLGAEHGVDQRLHARAGARTSTSPTARSTTGCGARTGSSATRSRCTRARRTRASIRPAR